MSESKFQLTPPTAILASGVLIAGAILFTNYYSPQELLTPPAGVEGAASALSIRPPAQDDHWQGSREAKIVLVEYSDFECPYCASIHPTLSRIVEESQGTVAWVYRHFPLESIHPEARASAIASECVAEQLGDEGFWAFAESAFANQRSLGSEYYAQVASQLGADGGAFAACVASGKYDHAVSEDYSEALENGGRGTPFTIITDGEVQAALNGAVSYATIQAVIEALLRRQQ